MMYNNRTGKNIATILMLLLASTIIAMWDLRGIDFIERIIFIEGSEVQAIDRINFTAQPVGGVIEIIQISSNYMDLLKADTHSAWYVGGTNLHTAIRHMDNIQTIVMGCFLMLFLLYLFLHFLYLEATLKNENLQKYNMMKREHIADITHETAAPLTVLSRYAEYLAEELRQFDFGEKSEQMARELDSMSDEAIRVAQLIDFLNEDTRKHEVYAKAETSIYDLVDNITRLYTPTLKREGTTLTAILPNGLPNIYANTGEVTQVFFNILRNAKKHTKGGRISIAAKIADIDSNFIEISITDTGVGIPRDKVSKVLLRGVGYDSGSGLGLAICNDIIKSMGGYLLVESEIGKGTVVSFSLPIWKGVQNG